MFERLDEDWQAFKRAPPGERFERFHDRRQKRRTSTAARVILVGAGVLLLAAGAFLMVVPGPGIPLVAFGAGFIASESKRASRALDWTELRLRALLRPAVETWRGASTGLRALIVSIGVIVAAAALYGGYVIFLAG